MNIVEQAARSIIITHDKGLLGDKDDYLIDDRIHKGELPKVCRNIDRIQGWLPMA